MPRLPEEIQGPIIIGAAIIGVSIIMSLSAGVFRHWPMVIPGLIMGGIAVAVITR